MNIVKFVFNPLQENTFVVWDQSLECIIIDAGNASASEHARLSAFIAEQNLKPVMAVNTHGHFDHTGGNGYFDEVYVHTAGVEIARKPFGDGGLADAGLADQNGVVLRAARKDLNDALKLFFAPDHRIKLSAPREIGEIAPVGVESGSLGLLRVLLLLLGAVRNG